MTRRCRSPIRQPTPPATWSTARSRCRRPCRPRPTTVSAPTASFAPLGASPLVLTTWSNPVVQRHRHARVQAVDRRHRRPAHGRVHEDADLHAVDHDSVSGFAWRPRPVCSGRGLFALRDGNCEQTADRRVKSRGGGVTLRPQGRFLCTQRHFRWPRRSREARTVAGTLRWRSRILDLTKAGRVAGVKSRRDGARHGTAAPRLDTRETVCSPLTFVPLNAKGAHANRRAPPLAD